MVLIRWPSSAFGCRTKNGGIVGRLNERRTTGAKAVGHFVATEGLAGYLRDVDVAVERAKVNLRQAVAESQNKAGGFAQGDFAEFWHAETFNVDAIVKRASDLRAHVPRSNEYLSADIVLSEHGDEVAAYSSKYWGTAKQSADQQKPYPGQERLIPSDQLDDAREHLARHIPKELEKDGSNRAQVAEDLQDVQDHLTSKVSHDGVESRDLTRKGSEAEMNRIRRGEAPRVEPQYGGDIILRESLQAGAVAGAITLATTLAPRIHAAIVYRVKEGDWPPDVMKGVLRDGGVALGGALRATVATSITMSARAGVLGEALKTVDPTVVGALTFLAFEGVKDYDRWKRGEIAGVDFADGMLMKSAGATGGAIGASVGQALIPIPVAGAMIGAMVGSIIASQGYRCLDYVSDSYFRSTEFKDLVRITRDLAAQWSALVTDYTAWRATATKLDIYFNAGVAQLDALETETADVFARLRAAADGDIQ